MIDKRIILGAFVVLFALGMFFYPTFSGLLLITSLLAFGALSSMWKEKNLKLMCLAAIVLLSLFNITLHGLKFGIDFSGGTRIPVILESPASDELMNEMVDTIKKRASAFGLTEVKVRGIGDTQINVEVPSSDPALIQSVEDVLSHQGVFTGVVDGKAALKGEYILPGTIQKVPAQYLRGADWGVSFSVTREGAEHFASSVKGKANYPVYMFLDRPEKAIVILTLEEASASMEFGEKQDVHGALSEALGLEGKDIPVYFYGDINVSTLTLPQNGTKVILSQELADEIGGELEGKGFVLSPQESITPTLTYNQETQEINVDEWEAVGLLSSPRLNPDITTGIPSYGYTISGPAQGVGQEKTLNAFENARRIESILKGGALPIQISLGSKTTVPAPLGEEFLRLSIIGLGLALIAISLLVSLRYRKGNILLPIIIISFSEMVILLSVLGSFTIDLAAMAGIIAAIGVGVDAQIVITDELLKKGMGSAKERLDNAFAIITTNVTVAVFAMVPLLFSGLVEVIGFAISTILGSLLGLLISRPAYAAIVEDIAEE